MKKAYLAAFLIIFGIIIIFSCSKSVHSPSSLSISTEKVQPSVPNCGAGLYWDFYLGKCVPICPSGYHNDSITGACVINGGSNYINVITNSNNPYDYSGNQHNNGVNSILPQINSSSNLDSTVLVKDKFYLASIGYNADSMQSFYDRAVENGYFPFSHLQELDSLGNTMYANGVLSYYGNSYVQQIYNYAYEYLNTDTVTSVEYNSFANSLISLEASIKNDSRISSWEKQVILSGCSIGRYSGAYWGNYINNKLSNPAIAMQPFLFKHLQAWLKIVLSDIGGAIVGISGGPVGIIGGAVGSSLVTAVTIYPPA